MADHMLTIEEARQRGLHIEPLRFTDVTNRTPTMGHDYNRHTCFFESRFYFVARTEIIDANDAPVTWLSIRRNDRKAQQDWRHLQAIKNDLCGPEREAIQLYPAESRLIDESNQIHLFVYQEDVGFPLGYAERSVRTATELQREYEIIEEAAPGALPGVPKQRPFSRQREADSETKEQIIKRFKRGDDSPHVTSTFHRPADSGGDG